MFIFLCELRRSVSAGIQVASLLCVLSFVLPAQSSLAASIEDHYYGATLFVVPTGNPVSPPIGVNSLVEYVNVYGQVAGPNVDHGYQAARLFFANGGETLYVIDPQGTQAQDFADALAASVELPVDLVAIPGAACCSGSIIQHAAIMSALSEHAATSPNRFALIDAPLGSDSTELQNYRTAFSSENSAIYAPWLTMEGQTPGTTISVAPSSAVAGVISRIDRDDGIHTSPAGSIADLKVPPVVAVAREFSMNERGDLNAANVNLLGNFFSQLTVHVWGVRTTSDAGSTKYVAVSRLVRHLEFSIDTSLAGSLNGPPSSADVSATESLINDYLYSYWVQGAFAGATSSNSYFVNCEIVVAGLHCTVGVAALKPAEFQVFQLDIPFSLDIFESGFEASAQ